MVDKDDAELVDLFKRLKITIVVIIIFSLMLITILIKRFNSEDTELIKKIMKLFIYWYIRINVILAKESKLFKKQKMNHDYPHCWRCNTPLVYYSKPSLYIKKLLRKMKLLKKIIKLICIQIM